MNPENAVLQSRRQALVLMTGALLATQSGCAVKQWFVSKADFKSQPAVIASDATLDEVADHINRDRAKVSAWRSSSVRVTASGEGLLQPRLSATVCVASPRSLRIVAGTALTGPEVDFGSNDERFWCCIKRQDPKVIMTGLHSGSGKLDVLPIPIEANWLMETLGVVPLDVSNAQMVTEQNGQRLRIETYIDLNGRSMKRVIVVDRQSGHPVEDRLLNESGQLVARATLSDYRPLPNGASLAHHIAYEWIESKQSLTLEMSRIDANPTFPETTWQMPQYANYQVFDLDRPQRR